jgi:hypothetical protein
MDDCRRRSSASQCEPVYILPAFDAKHGRPEQLLVMEAAMRTPPESP